MLIGYPDIQEIRLQNLLLGLTYAKYSNRQLLIYLMFATLTMVVAKGCKEHLKYCHMIAETCCTR